MPYVVTPEHLKAMREELAAMASTGRPGKIVLRPEQDLMLYEARLIHHVHWKDFLKWWHDRGWLGSEKTLSNRLEEIKDTPHEVLVAAAQASA